MPQSKSLNSIFVNCTFLEMAWNIREYSPLFLLLCVHICLSSSLLAIGLHESIREQIKHTKPSSHIPIVFLIISIIGNQIIDRKIF